MRTLRIAVAAVALLSATAASAMTVAEFVRRADAVAASGLLAPFNSDLPVLRGEIRTAIRALRTEEASARARRRTPAFCLPPEGTQIDPFEILEQLRGLSPAQRRLQVKDGLRIVARRRFPCG